MCSDKSEHLPPQELLGPHAHNCTHTGVHVTPNLQGTSPHTPRPDPPTPCTVWTWSEITCAHRHPYACTYMLLVCSLSQAWICVSMCILRYPHSQAACLSPGLVLSACAEKLPAWVRGTSSCLWGTIWTICESRLGTAGAGVASVDRKRLAWPIPTPGPRLLSCQHPLGRLWVKLICSPNCPGEQWALLEPKPWFLSPLSPLKGTRDL